MSLSFIRRLDALEGAPEWSTTAGRITDAVVRSGCAVLTQLHVIAPIHANPGFNLEALGNMTTARIMALGMAATYTVVKQGYDAVMSMEDSLPSSEAYETESRLDEVPSAAAH